MEKSFILPDRESQIIKEISRDETFLAQKAKPATLDDLSVVQDLLDTLDANKEGRLSLERAGPTKRWQSIKVRYQNEKLQEQFRAFTGRTAQNIQHEVDHCEGIII